MNDKPDESVFPVLSRLFGVETADLRREIDGVLKSNDYCTLQFATPKSDESAAEIVALRDWEEKEADAYAAILARKSAVTPAAVAEKDAAAYEAIESASVARGVWVAARAERARSEFQTQPLPEADLTSRESWRHCWPAGVEPGSGYSTLTLAPLSVECTGAILSDARRGTDLLALDVYRVGERVLLKNFSQLDVDRVGERGHQQKHARLTPNVSVQKQPDRSAEIIDVMSSGELGAVTRHGLYLTVIIKKNNQKKHHSHRLFFDKWLPMHKERLGKHVFPKYAFCSDVGTLYGPRMLHMLMTYMDSHAEVAASA